MELFVAPTKNHTLFDKHKTTIEEALGAVFKREHYTPYPEMPSGKVYGESGDADGKAAFEKQLNGKFDRLHQDHDSWMDSDEKSPYTQESLGLSYPVFKQPQDYVSKSNSIDDAWKITDAETRAGILVESLERLKADFFELAYSTMHTTGQSYLMSFQASGPHAADRALEAVVIGYQELTRYPAKVSWEKTVGGEPVKLDKFGINVPKGVALSIGCGTFPTWNTVPGLYASLVTGNSVIVKPHPNAIYPIAIVVAHIQDVLKENGFDPNLVLLACDSEKKLIAKDLAMDVSVKIIDFTGGTAFGSWIETLPDKITFTEKSGVNTIIIDSFDDLKAMAKNIAFSLCLYSGQMCTTPQNIFIPKDGIKSGDKTISYEEVRGAIVESVKKLSTHPKIGHVLLGALQSDTTLERVEGLKDINGKLLLDSAPIENPEFPKVRGRTPAILEIKPESKEIYENEQFGPISFIIPAKDTAESIELARSCSVNKGAISCGAYCTDQETVKNIASVMAQAATPVSFNLTGNIYVNQNAGFSDWHVTGGNPAGNASFTNSEFVLKRFTRVQSRVNVG